MDAIAYIQREVDGLRWQTNMILKETTDEQLNWAPPGIANPIGVTLLHTIGTEDQLVQQLLQGKPSLWESGNWSERIGVQVVPREGRGWEECRKAYLSLAPIMEYQEAVCSATADYIASLTPEDLDRPMMLFGCEQPLAIVLVIIVNHAILHMGEIAALKGIQGIKGLPF
jgi:hypothetical protein